MAKKGKDDDNNDEKKGKKRRFNYFWEDSDYNPFEEIDRMQSRMNDIMRHMWEGMQTGGSSIGMGRPTARVPIDMADAGDAIVIRANLPGVDKDNVTIDATSRAVEISAEQKKETRDSGENFFRQERSVGRFSRTLSLPAEVDPDGAEARMENGVLEVVLPKLEKDRKGKSFKPK